MPHRVPVPTSATVMTEENAHTIQLLKEQPVITMEQDDHRMFCECAQTGIFIAGTNGLILYANPAFTEFIGFQPHEMVGKKYHDWIHPDDIHSTINIQTKLIKGDPVYSFDNRYKHKKGHFVWLNWQAVMKHNKYYAQCLKRGNNSKLLSRIAHELKTPLTHVSGFAQLMQLQPTQCETSQHSIQMILKASEEIEGMIDNLLDMSNISETNIRLVPMKIDDMIRSCVDLFALSASDRGIRIDFHELDSNHVVNIDAAKFNQVLKNLMSNALKYNKQHGTVTIRCAVDEGHLLVSFQDSGIGISPEDTRKLYLPFERLGDTRAHEGSGIGLAHSKKILDFMDIGIECESVLGEYTKFTMRLKIMESCAQELLVDTVYTTHKSKLTILYVEDSGSTMMLVKAICRQYFACEFLEAKNGMDGLAMLSAHSVDLLLLDLGLPDIDGMEVYRRAKTQHLWSTSDIAMVISAEAHAKTINEILQEGVFQYIRKPIQIPHLVATIKEALGKMNKLGAILAKKPIKKRL